MFLVRNAFEIYRCEYDDLEQGIVTDNLLAFIIDFYNNRNQDEKYRQSCQYTYVLEDGAIQDYEKMGSIIENGRLT